jgi:hypothetical protein
MVPLLLLLLLLATSLLAARCQLVPPAVLVGYRCCVS